VTGGYVYRVRQRASLPARTSTRISLTAASGAAARSLGTRTRLLLDTDYSIASFGEDDEGELYVVDYSGGGIYRVVAE